jgi:hypothetical protein
MHLRPELDRLRAARQALDELGRDAPDSRAYSRLQLEHEVAERMLLKLWEEIR